MPDVTFTTKEGGLELLFEPGSSVIVTIFEDDLGGAPSPSGVSYLRVYDVHVTANEGILVTLEFKIPASDMEAEGILPSGITILHYHDGQCYQMSLDSVQLVDGTYVFTVSTVTLSPFMVAYDVDENEFPLENITSTPVETPTTIPTGTKSTPAATEMPASPIPLAGIIAGLLATVFVMRRG